MNVAKRTTRSKLRKGLTAEGEEFYFSKRPSSKKSDHADSKPKAPPRVREILVTKSKKT